MKTQSMSILCSITTEALSPAMPRMLALNLCCSSMASGDAVLSSTVPAIPPSISDALGDL